MNKKKLKRLKEELEGKKEVEEKAKKRERIKRKILRKILTSKARSRLANVRIAKPKFARRIESQLIQLAQLGRVKKIDDEKLKSLLRKFSKKKREYDVGGLF